MDDPTRALLLEQYKSLVGDVGNVGTRYATSNGFYLSVLTALLGVLAYVGAGKVVSETTYPAAALVAIFAIVICWLWRKTIVFYGKLFGGKFAVLKEIEQELPFKVYKREFEEVYGKRKAEYLTNNEAKVPLVLAGFFAVVALLALYFSFCPPNP